MKILFLKPLIPAFMFGLGISFAGGYWYTTHIAGQEQQQESSQQTASVEKSDLTESISVSGDAALVDEQSLRFTTQGTITAVYFKAGENVKKGDVIAQIDDSDGQRSITDAELSLENAKIALQQLYEGPDKSSVLSSQNTITSAKNNLENVQKELENLKISQENEKTQLQKSLQVAKSEYENDLASYNLAEKELDLAKKQNEDSLSSTTSSKNTTVLSLESNLENYRVEAKNILDEVDVIFGITQENRKKNDDYEDYLGRKNTTALSSTKSSFDSAYNAYESYVELLDSYDHSGEKSSLEVLYSSVKQLYTYLYSLTDYAYTAVDGSIPSVGSLTESEIESMKSTMNSSRSSALSKITSINSNVNTLATLTNTQLTQTAQDIEIANKTQSLVSQKLSLEKSKNELEAQQKNYEETLASQELSLKTKQEELTSKENALTIAQLNYEDLLEGPTAENVQKAKNSITSAQIKLESAKESLEDYQLIAPFDGVVRKIDYQVGDNLTSDTEKYVYIENPNLLQISVYLDQIDITKVKLGQKAVVTFDAFSTTPVDAVVTSIDTTPIESSGVVSYEVKIVLDDEDFKQTILSGMTADIEIIVNAAEDVLVVDTTAIQEKDGSYTVTKIENGQQIQTPVEIGMASDGKTEITSGLSEGDVVLLSTFSVDTTEEESSTTLFGPGAGGNKSSSNRQSGDFGGPPGF